MKVLWAQDGITQRDLSFRTGTTQPTTTIAINILERQSLVQRIRDPGDRRRVGIHLTPQGHKLRDPLQLAGQEVGQEVTATIPRAALAAMFGVLRQIQDNLAKL